MPKPQIPRSRKIRAAKPKRKLHELEVLADEANGAKLSSEELQGIFREYLPAPKTVDGIEQEAKRTWTFTDGPSLKSTPELKDKVWSLFEENMRDMQVPPLYSFFPLTKDNVDTYKPTTQTSPGTHLKNSKNCTTKKPAEEDEDGEMRFLVYIYEIQVAKGQRGTGIFRRILAGLEGMCAELGVQVIMLTCFKCNTQALPVYAHLGFKEIEGESETSQEFWKPVLQPDEWSTA
ncbi:unnamed protein product [Rhizoctonia solani]|uniref:N-alpha-acetyltransferase 40 n=1 Tax=Rhizoctonia solani TaxID=456999 RepID=A0A8H3DD43_9AGAM|nr:unnamed protein product [Rhizoctonia solani]